MNPGARQRHEDHLRPSAGLFGWLPVLCLCLILALGAYIRARSTANVSLSLDEAWRIVGLLEAPDLLHQMLSGQNRTDPPLFSLLIYTLGRIHDTEFFLRLAAIVPGILAIALAYAVARRLFRSPWLAALGAFLTAFSPDLVMYSKELKPFSLGALVQLGAIWAYLGYRRGITPRSTLAFTALLALFVPFAMHGTFSYPGIYLALLAESLLQGTRRQRILVTGSALALLSFCVVYYLAVIHGASDDLGSLPYMQGYWGRHFCPGDSFGDALAWLAPRYRDHYSALAFSNGLLPGVIDDHFTAVYFALGMLGLLLLLAGSRRRFFQAFCLFVLPLVVMALFSSRGLWPFGRLRMNLFVFWFVLYPALHALDELSAIAARSTVLRGIAARLRGVLPSASEPPNRGEALAAQGGHRPEEDGEGPSGPAGGLAEDRRASLLAAAVVCLAVLVQAPPGLRALAGLRADAEDGAPVLEHILDRYAAGPTVPLVVNYLGGPQFNYYSEHHRRLSPRYRRQAALFDPLLLPERSSASYIRGAMLRLCQEHEQAAVYLTHYRPSENETHDNEFCIDHDRRYGRKSLACLITSEIHAAARHRHSVLEHKRLVGTNPEWHRAYLSPILGVEDAPPGSLIVFNFDLRYNLSGKKLRFGFLDESNSPDDFEMPTQDYQEPVETRALASAVCTRLEAPIAGVRLAILARGEYDFDLQRLEYFVVPEASCAESDPGLRVEARVIDKARFIKSIRGMGGFLDDGIHRFGWTTGDAELRLEGVAVDPAAQLLQLETHGWLPPRVRGIILQAGLRVYVNGFHRALLLEIENRESAPKLLFRLPGGIQDVASLRIKSPTFVPQQLGIGGDTRSLGIDVKSISFPRLQPEPEKRGRGEEGGSPPAPASQGEPPPATPVSPSPPRPHPRGGS